MGREARCPHRGSQAEHERLEATAGAGNAGQAHERWPGFGWGAGQGREGSPGSGAAAKRDRAPALGPFCGGPMPAARGCRGLFRRNRRRTRSCRGLFRDRTAGEQAAPGWFGRGGGGRPISRPAPLAPTAVRTAGRGQRGRNEGRRRLGCVVVQAPNRGRQLSRRLFGFAERRRPRSDGRERLRGRGDRRGREAFRMRWRHPSPPGRLFLGDDEQHARDVAAGAGWVELPEALDRKYPNAAREWPWQ